MNRQQMRMIEGAKNYAEADRSDPFAFSRAMCHLNNGVAGLTARGDDGFYQAEPHQEERLLPDDGRSEAERTYFVTVYRNIQRP